MRDILPKIDGWLAQSKPVALATVIQTWGSSPRGVGSKMAFTADGDVAGSVSGGCVEAAVITQGSEVLKDRVPRLLHFGVADETAWEVGLTCGGSLDVFVARLDDGLHAALRDAVIESQAAALITATRAPVDILGREVLLRHDGRTLGSLGSDLDAPAIAHARQAVLAGTSSRYAPEPDVELFVEVFEPPITLVMVGGVHIAAALIPLARTLGWSTVLIDPRKTWANLQRFPDVDRMLTSWPQEAFGDLKIDRSTAVITLTHDPKLDDPALQAALPGPAFYVAALGSRSSQAKRRARLLDAGMSESELSRLHAPAGLDIAARTPQEIAISIVAEIVASHRPRPQNPVSLHSDRPKATPLAESAAR